MIVHDSEVVTMLVSDMKFHLSTEQGLNRMDARKFTRVLKRIKTIINKFWNCIFCKKVEGPWRARRGARGVRLWRRSRRKCGI